MFSKPLAKRHQACHSKASQHRPSSSYSQKDDIGDDNPSKRQRTSAVTDLYQVKKVHEVLVKKFKTKRMTYKVKFNENLDVQDPTAILDTLHRVFESLLGTLTTGAEPHDMFRIVVTCAELDYPIELPFITKDKLTAERFLARVEQVLQSNEEFSIDSSLEIQMTHVSMPLGGKHKKKYFVNLKRFLKEKQYIIQIQNKDDLCCARAIVTAKAKVDKHKKWEAIRHGCTLQQKLAENLHTKAGVPKGECGLDEIKRFQEVLIGYQIMLVSMEHFNAFIYSGPPAVKRLILYFHHGHYDIITSMASFLNRSYFCPNCQKGYDHIEDHRCKNSCKLCFQVNCVQKKWVYCKVCNRSFRSTTCFKNHQKETSPGKSVCKTHYKCCTCSQLVSRRLHRGKEHVCGEKYCSTCKEFFPPDHLCYMQPVTSSPSFDSSSTNEPNVEHTLGEDEQTEDDASPPYIFFDFECMQETGIHEPNLCIAHKVCSQCLHQEGGKACQRCGERERTFDGQNTAKDFCEWLFEENNAGAIVICHNFKGYDSYFILRYLYDNAILPKVILNGAKVMSIDVAANNMKFIDSMNFLPMALSKLPGAFGITELAKGHFPHFFNTRANQDKVLTHLPDIKYYNPDSMKAADRQKFIEWYNKHQHDSFDLKQEILKYCKSDVDILRRCCLHFRSLFMDMTADGNTPGIDPFQHCITIASACNLVYRTKYLKPTTIGIIPPLGYRSNDKQSIKALKWLKWISHKTGQHIQHAANNGEKLIGKYKADGFYVEDGVETVLEFHGCLHHGHTCMARSTKHPLNHHTMEELYQRTIEKHKFIVNKGYQYKEKWECEFEAELQKDAEMNAFVSSLEIPTPLCPRDAFFGGRTNATKLYYKAKSDETIRYLDFTSLYPYVNKYKKYPVGHPTIITENFLPDINEYEGLVKCKVLPPRKMYHPVAPYKASSRLMFPLCSTCSETQQQSPCSHTDEERALTGTWVTMELQKALSIGYTLLKIYEVWHFDEVSMYDPDTKEGGLFANYINAFLKVKQEASDWPEWCKTDEDKRQYIKLFKDKEGIQLDWNNIKKNPGLRALAKLMLNSFWGKFGQRSNMPKTEHVTDHAKFFEMMTDDKIYVNSVNFINNEMVEVHWQNLEDFVEPSTRTNVVIAAYTTAHARLKLYELLENLGRRVLYFDTDSVIYVSRKGETEYEPKIGDFLGELKNEIESDNHIIEFVSGGPKNYAYNLAKPDRDGYSTLCKVRGITMSYRNQAIVNFDTMFNMVRKEGAAKVQVTDPNKICRNKKNVTIETKEEKKTYQVVYVKRVQTKNFDTLPYGY